jgi:hypothetical protein
VTEGGRRVEHNAEPFVQARPDARIERTRDLIVLNLPTPRPGNEDVDELTLVVSPEGVELRLPQTEWTMGAYGPAQSSKFLRRYTMAQVQRIATAEILGTLAALYRKNLKKCRMCGARFLAIGKCHACAEAGGLVF